MMRWAWRSGRAGRRGTAASVLLAGVVVIGMTGVAAAGGGSGGAIPPGTIYFQRITVPADTLAVAADGSGLRETGCMGIDRTMTAPRRVLRLEATGVTFGTLMSDGTLWTRDQMRLVSTNEACGDRVVLAELPARTTATTASWSLDGTRVAIAAYRYDEAGVLAEQGIWVGEVGGSCGSPLCGLHLAVTLPMTTVQGPPGGPTRVYPYELPSLRWSSDGRRVVEARRIDPAQTEMGIFVADLGQPGSTAVLTDRQVVVPGGSAFEPAFSPVPGDDRIAFVQRVSTRSCIRNDVFITTSAGGTARRVGATTNGMCQLSAPGWSPDATWIAVSAWSGALADQQAIYRFKADGTVKPILVAEQRNAAYHLPAWRP